MVTTITSKKTLTENKDKELTSILDKLSHDPNIKLDQMKSLIVVCLAFEIIPGHIVEYSIKHLRLYKRKNAIEIVSTTFYILQSISYNVYLPETGFDSVPDLQN